MKRELPEQSTNEPAKVEEEDEDDEEDVSMIDVDFEFFDFNSKVDFHALNTLLKQLLGPDSTNFELGALVDLLLEQKIGSTVKVDGEESDPFAFLTVLGLNKHAEHPQVKLLTEYITSKAKKDETCYNSLTKLLASTANGQTGLLLSERLINMPAEVSPPLYRILSEEMGAKAATDSQYSFSHYILISKSYTEIASKLDEEEVRPKKKNKKGKASKETFYFHAEDEIFVKYATHRVQFPYSNESPESDSKRAFHDFGIKPSGELVILTKEQFSKAVAEIQETFPF